MEAQRRLKQTLLRVHNSRQVQQIDTTKLTTDECLGLLSVIDKLEAQANSKRRYF
jgi:hypothetical protein